MGALHEGHASLIRTAKLAKHPVLVTIFVNPTQFGPSEDFSRYPRTLEVDLGLAETAGADAVFVPSIGDIYPDGIDIAKRQATELALPPTANQPKLEDAGRPTHFGGVCQVVARLFDLCRPSLAHFGEKDFQQLRVITQLVELNSDRWQALKIVPCKTVREPDGLAMSSRNRYLNVTQRQDALGLWRALQVARECENLSNAEVMMRATLEQHGLDPEYAVVRSSKTLCAIDATTNSARILVAAKLGEIRLIDNAPFGN